MTITIILEKRHLRLWGKWVLLLAFFYLVVLCDGYSVPAPGLAEAVANGTPYRPSWRYYLLRLGAQLLHQYPKFPIAQGVLPALSGAAFVTTLSGLLWTGAVGGLFFPSGWTLTGENIREHLSLSRLIAGMTLFQLSQTIKPEAIPGELPSSFILAKGLVGIPLFLLAVSVLGSRSRRRVMEGRTSWREELLLFSPFLLGCLILLGFLAGVVLRPDWGRGVNLPLIPNSISRPELVCYFLMAACWAGMELLGRRRKGQ